MSESGGFLSRWARRKSQSARCAEDEAHAPAPEPEFAQAPETRETEKRAPDSVGTAAGEAVPPGTKATGDASPPTVPVELPSVDTLRPDSDFRPFMRGGVDPGTRSAALRRLFADPHFNRMDGLDIYIDDYGKADPIPAAMLRMLEQARSLNLFGDESGSGESGAEADPSAVEADGADGVASEPRVADARDVREGHAEPASRDGGAPAVGGRSSSVDEPSAAGQTGRAFDVPLPRDEDGRGQG